MGFGFGHLFVTTDGHFGRPVDVPEFAVFRGAADRFPGVALARHPATVAARTAAYRIASAAQPGPPVESVAAARQVPRSRPVGR